MRVMLKFNSLNAACGKVEKMAGFAAQAEIRSKWSDLIESTQLEISGEVSSGVRSVVGWLKQVKYIDFIFFATQFSFNNVNLC